MGKLAKKLDDMNADDIWFATPEEDYLSILENEKEIARDEGLAEGQAKGLEEGRIKEQKSFIENMLKEEIPLEIISKCSGLSIAELQNFLN